MNLHFSLDDKFLDVFIENAKKFSKSKNRYIVFANDYELKLTKNIEAVEVFDFNEEIIDDFLNNQEGIGKIFFHSFPDFFARLILRNKLWENYKIYWLFFGYEFFSMLHLQSKLFGKETLRFFKKANPDLFFRFSINPIQLRRNWINFRFYSKRKKNNEKICIEAMNKVHCFGHFIQEDYCQYIKFINKKVQYIDWTYGLAENNKKGKFFESSKKNSILLGNSASIFNNHLDGLRFLKKVVGETNAWEIITPLSYSGTQEYINEIIQKGSLLFPEKFRPLVDFIEKEEYFKLISKIKAAVFFNIRSQAAGNITWLILQGVPVFMVEKSNLFKFFAREGIKIFSIEKELRSFLKNGQTDRLVLENNKIKLERIFGEEALRKKYVNLLEG